MNWIEYKYPKLSRGLLKTLEGATGASFTVGGFIAAIEEAGLSDTFNMDSLELEVPMGRMIEIFGVPELRIGTWEELKENNE